MFRLNRIGSKFQLIRRVQGNFNLFLEVLNATCDRLAAVSLGLLQAQQFVGDVERSHDCNAFGADDTAGMPDFAHLTVHESGGLQEGFPFLWLAGDAVLLVEDRDGYR